MNIYKNNIKGFTLLDVLLVSAIVSLISSVFLFQTTEAKKKAEDAHVKIESGQVATAIELYRGDNKGFTPLKVSSSNTPRGVMYTEDTQEYKEAMSILVDNNYLPQIPTSPSGDSYVYGESLDGTQAVFATKLKSSSSSRNNTRNSCDIIEPPSAPPSCTQVYLGKIPQKGVAPEDGTPVYEYICPSTEGFVSVCSQEQGEIIPPGETQSQEMRVRTCTLEPDPEYPNFCSGQNQEDYCLCI